MNLITKYGAYEKKGGEGPSATKTEDNTPVATSAFNPPRCSYAICARGKQRPHEVVDFVTVK